MEVSGDKTIDVEVQTLFTKFDRGHQGHLTRVQIADILTDIFKTFALNNPVSELDVNNFLLDYDIKHNGDLTRKDFQGIQKLRFVLRELPSSPIIKVPIQQLEPQVKKIVVPVTMLFDIFNRRHDGHLTRDEIRQVINLIFKDFHMPYQVNHLDVDNFLLDFDINHDREITMDDFKGIDVLTFDLHHQKELGMQTKIKMKVN